MLQVTRSDFRDASNGISHERYKIRMVIYLDRDEFLLNDDVEYMVAGGFLNSVDSQRNIQDLDLYPRDQDNYDKLVNIMSNHGYEKTNNTWKKGTKKIQIMKEFVDPLDVLCGFDFTVTMKGWIPKTQTIYEHNKYQEHIRHRELKYNTTNTHPLKNVYHMSKYISYGYHISPFDLMAILFKINHLNLDDMDVFKDQVMYYESDDTLNRFRDIYDELAPIRGPNDSKQKLLTNMGFSRQVDNIKSGRCATCSNPVNGSQDFRDALSIKEYGISGMCQRCQDEVFD